MDKISVYRMNFINNTLNPASRVPPQSPIIIHGDKDYGALFVHINFQAGITHLNFLRIFVTLLLFPQKTAAWKQIRECPYIEQRF